MLTTIMCNHYPGFNLLIEQYFLLSGAKCEKEESLLECVTQFQMNLPVDEQIHLHQMIHQVKTSS